MADQHDFSAIGPEGALGRRLFIMTTRPAGEAARAAIRSGAMRREHLDYIIGLEKAGVIFAGGPLLDGLTRAAVSRRGAPACGRGRRTSA